MLQPLIMDVDGVTHGVTHQGTFGKFPNQRIGTGSWCGTSLQEWVRLKGFYSSVSHQEGGHDPRKAVTCLTCLSEGP